MRMKFYATLIAVALALSACGLGEDTPGSLDGGTTSTTPAALSTFVPTTGTETLDMCSPELSALLGYSVCHRAPVCVSDTRTDCVRWGDMMSLLIALQPPLDRLPSTIPTLDQKYHYRSGAPTVLPVTVLGKPSGIHPNAEKSNPDEIACWLDESGPVCGETVIVDGPPLPDPGPVDPGSNPADGHSGSDHSDGGSGGGNSDHSHPSPPSPRTSTPSPPPTSSSPSPSPTSSDNAYCATMGDQLALACNNRRELACTIAAGAGAKFKGAAGAAAATTLCKVWYNTMCAEFKTDPCSKHSVTIWFGYRPRGADGPVIGFGEWP